MDNKPPPRPQPGGRSSHRLFDEDPPTSAPMPRTPFGVYLKTTPAAPLPAWVQALLWVVGLAVALLLVAALTKGARPRRARAAWDRPAVHAPIRADA
jgi:hypothetical protein